jgi:hypothetical protein
MHYSHFHDHNNVAMSTNNSARSARVNAVIIIIEDQLCVHELQLDHVRHVNSTATSTDEFDN